MKWYSTKNPSKALILVFLIVIVGLGSFLRFYQIGNLSFWLDEVTTKTYSKNFLGTIRTDPNMSLYFILTFFWTRIFPNASDGMLRALSALLSVASIPMVFLLGKTVAPNQKSAKAIGLIAAFLITLNAFNIQFAQEFRSYSLTFLLTILSTYFFIRIIEDSDSKKKWLIWYIIVTCASVYSHFYSVFLIAAQALTLPILLVDKKKYFYNFKRILVCYIAIVCLVLPIAIIAYNIGPEAKLYWISKPTLKTLGWFFIELSGGRELIQGLLLFALNFLFGCIGFLVGTGIGFQQSLITKWKFSLITSCLFFPIIAAFVISRFSIPIFQSHYLLYVMPYLTILVSTGIVTFISYVWNRIKNKYVFITAGISILFLFVILLAKGVQSYYDNYQKDDWRSATRFLTSSCSNSLRLYYPNYVETPVLYYNPALNSQEPGWYNLLNNNTNLDETVASFSSDFDQVCLVLANYDVNEKTKLKVFQDAIVKYFPNESIVNFFGVEIDIYKR